MIAATILLLAVVCLYGVPIARTLDRNVRGSALIGAGFLLGSGFVGLEMFFLSVLGVRWSMTAIVLGALPVLVVASGVWRRQPPPLHRETRSGGFANALLNGVIALPIIGHGFYATWTGLHEWDFFGIWGLKARWFFEHGGIDWSFVQRSISHPDYPLLVPLLYDFVAVAGGRWEERSLGLIFTFMCAAVILIARDMLIEEGFAIGTLAVVFPALNMWVGLAEGAVMAFGCAGLLFIRRGSMALGAVLLGFAAWSKNEGLALIGAVVVALVIARRWRDAIRLWPALAVIAPWLITRAVLALPTDFVDGRVFHRMLTRIADPWTTLRVFASLPAELFWIAVALVLVIYVRAAWTRERFLTTALVVQMLLFFAQGIATRAEFRPHVSLTMNRLPQQLAPAFAFLAVVLVFPDLIVGARRRAGSTTPPPN